MRKEQKLFVILSGIFIANTLIAEFIGGKIFSLQEWLSISNFNFHLFGMKMGLDFTAGVLIWPVVFILTDIINDYYGVKGVRFITFLSVGIIIYAFIAVNFAINAPAAGWWLDINKQNYQIDAQQSFAFIFGQGQNIIIGSLVAFALGQILDAYIFKTIKNTNRGGQLWFRATVSTLISQFFDSFVVIFIAFKIGQNWTWQQTISVSINNYLYKGILAIISIPLLILIHKLIHSYLGNDLSVKLRKSNL